MSPIPFVSKRAPAFKDIPNEKWNDWRWQLSNRLNSVEDFENVLKLTDSERKALSSPGLFRVDVTPYYISLINPDDPNDPIRKQIIPTAGEIDAFTGQMEDSLAEDRHSPVPGLVHRYPDRVLMLVTTQCASYCRYCTRARIVGDPTQTFSRTDFEAQIEYLKHTPQVRDVLLSGGDPLTLAPKLLEELLSCLREIEPTGGGRVGFADQAQRVLGQIRSELEYRPIADILEHLTEHMENVQSATSAASEAIRERYFPTNAMPMWVGETT